MDRNPILIVTLLLVALVAAGCSSSGDSDGSWVVAEMATPAGSMVAPVGVTITLNVENGKFSGNAGCNDYFGDTAVDSQPNQIGTTLKMCPDPVMLQEDLYVSLLSDISSAEVDGDSMQAKDSDGTTLIVYTRVASS